MAAIDHTHRTQIHWASGLNLLVGAWLVASAVAVYARGPMATNDVLCGTAIATLAAVRAFGGAEELGWLSWLNAALGAWVIVSPWAVAGVTGPTGPTHRMILTNCVTGGVVLVLACWSARATDAGLGHGTHPQPAPAPLGR